MVERHRSGWQATVLVALALAAKRLTHIPSFPGRQFSHGFLAFTQAHREQEPDLLHLQHAMTQQPDAIIEFKITWWRNVEIAVAKPVLSYFTTNLTLEHTYVRTRIRIRAPEMELRKFPGQQLLPCPRIYAVNMFGRCTLPRRFAAR